LAQFAVLAQPHFGFAKAPVFVSHQAKNRQQLRLTKLVLAETASLTREHCLGDFQCNASKRQQSDFGHCVPTACVADNNVDEPPTAKFHRDHENVNRASLLEVIS
jgi:hypothetical protein